MAIEMTAGLKKAAGFLWRQIGAIFDQIHWRTLYGFRRNIAFIIDEQSIQMAVVQHLWHRRKLVNVTKAYFPPSESEEKRRNFITAEIQRYLQQYRRPVTKYILGVGGPESAIRIISLPHMPSGERDQAIFWEGNKQIPFGLEDAYYGYHGIPSARNDASNISRILLLAVSKKEIHRCLDQIRSVIAINAVNYEPEAIGQFLPLIDGYSPDKTYILINIKKNVSEIGFYRGSRLEFKHVSSFGSGILAGAGKDMQMYSGFVESLMGEVQNSLDFYIGQYSRSLIETVLVYGDLCYSEELLSGLTEMFGIKFRRFPITQWLKSQPQTVDFVDQISVSAGAVALAMANSPLIDLRPPEMKEAAAVAGFQRKVIPIAVLALAAMISIWASLKYQVNIDNGQLLYQQNLISEFQGSSAFAMYNKIKQEMASSRSLLEKLSHEPTFLHLNLKELSLLTPATVRLENYEMQNNGDKYVLSLNGQAISSSTPPEVILAEYVARLGGSPFYRNVNLKKYTKRSQGTQFALDFQIEMETII